MHQVEELAKEAAWVHLAFTICSNASFVPMKAIESTGWGGLVCALCVRVVDA